MTFIDSKNKLEIFRRKIEKSQCRNSYLRYSLELKLIDDLIEEIDKQNKFSQELQEQKNEILDTLKQMGYSFVIKK